MRRSIEKRGMKVVDLVAWAIGDRTLDRRGRTQSGRLQLIGYLSVPLGLANSAEWNCLTAETAKKGERLAS